MPITLAKLTANRAHARIDFGGGDVLEVDYYPARLTGQMLQQFLAADRIAEMDGAQAADVLLSASALLLALLAGWDLTDERGAVLPIEAATLDSLGLQVQWRILTGMMQQTGAGSPGEATAPKPSSAGSGATSSRTARRLTR